MKYFIYENAEKLSTNYYESFSDATKAYDEILNSDNRSGKFYLGVQSDDISPKGGYCFDLVHMDKKDKESFVFLIEDYKNHTKEKDYDVIFENIIELKAHYNIEWKYSSVIGNTGSYIPVEDIHNSYINDKILRIPVKRNQVFFTSAINEVNVIGKGWIPYKSFLNYQQRVRITSVNVNYIRDDSHLGQIDVSVADAIKMINSMSHSYQLIGCLDRLTSVEDCKYYPVQYGSYETKEEAVKAFYENDAKFINHDCKKLIAQKGNIIFDATHPVKAEKMTYEEAKIAFNIPETNISHPKRKSR